MRNTFTVSIAFAAIISLAACGGGGQKNSTSTTTSAGDQTAGTAAPQLNSAAVPANLHCGAEPPVWSNPRTHVYHLSTDPYYGKTRMGSYMCRENAEQAGYHLAGSRGGAMNGGAMRGKHHRKHGSGAMMATPGASPEASPQ